MSRGRSTTLAGKLGWMSRLRSRSMSLAATHCPGSVSELPAVPAPTDMYNPLTRASCHARGRITPLALAQGTSFAITAAIDSAIPARRVRQMNWSISQDDRGVCAPWRIIAP
jgi:hypothetical protein